MRRRRACSCATTRGSGPRTAGADSSTTFSSFSFPPLPLQENEVVDLVPEPQPATLEFRLGPRRRAGGEAGSRILEAGDRREDLEGLLGVVLPIGREVQMAPGG